MRLKLTLIACVAGLLPQVILAAIPGGVGSCPANSSGSSTGYTWFMQNAPLGSPFASGWSGPGALCAAIWEGVENAAPYLSACSADTSVHGATCGCEKWNQSPRETVGLERKDEPNSCECNAGFGENADQCVRKVDRFVELSTKNQCSYGNPFYPTTGAKVEKVDLGIVIGDQQVKLVYNSARRPSASLWRLNTQKKLVSIDAAETAAINSSELDEFGMSALDWYAVSKSISNDLNVCTKYSQSNGTIGKLGNNDFQHTNPANGEIYQYGPTGNLISSTSATGVVVTAQYANNDDVLTGLTDSNGRSIQFTYVLPAGWQNKDRLVKTVVDSQGQTITFNYDTNWNLTGLVWPNGTSRTFLYEDTANPWALTGLIDENGSRFATWTYDGDGNATSSEHAGGVRRTSVARLFSKSSTVEEVMEGDTLCRYHITGGSGSASVTAGGKTSTLAIDFNKGYGQVTSNSQPAGSGCMASTTTAAYDIHGNITSKVDFNGNRICYAYDGNDQEITRVTGLPGTTDCATVLPEGATLPAGASKVTTLWHPHWKLPWVVTTEGAKVTTSYNGHTMWCSAAEPLPNNKAMPLVCKTVIQAMKNGAVDPTVEAAITTFTYDAAGRVLTATDSLNQTTSYTYYADTTFTNGVGHTIGDLYQVTNAAGKSVTVNSYDPSGRILKMTDPNGMVTEMTYTPRGWVTSVSVTPAGGSARVTTYTYDNVGQVTGVTNPDGTTMSMTYDAAHRLVGATDAKGNSVAYTLDNVGNRIAEELKDPSGTLQRTLSRTFDALNRVQQVKLQ